MSDWPFTISPDAEQWIKERLQIGARLPDVNSLAPVLTCSDGFRSWDENGKLTATYEGEFLDIGWDDRAKCLAAGIRAFMICGVQVFASAYAIERLRGKNLVVRMVEIGIPNPSSKTVPILVVQGEKARTRDKSK